MSLAKKFKKSLRDNSQVSSVSLYLNIFGEYPSNYSFDLKQGQTVNLQALTEEKIKEIIPTYKYYWQYAYSTAKSTSAVDDIDDEEDAYIFDSTFSETCVNVVAKHLIYAIYKDKITVYHHRPLKWIQDEVKRIISSLPMGEKEDISAKIQLVASDGRDYYTQKSSIKSTTVDLDLTYNDDFKDVNNKIQDFLNSRECGIVLLHGKPGTGKTTYIRHLVTNTPKDYIYIPNVMMPHLGSPEFISFITDHKNSVFILEDCEQILQDRAYNQFNNGISTILNMSDGLLSDICNIKFICTFNSDTETIDKALLRPGRCYANYEFGPLCEDKVKILAEKNNIPMKHPTEMTLADVFNKEEDSEDVGPKKKLGF